MHKNVGRITQWLRAWYAGFTRRQWPTSLRLTLRIECEMDYWIVSDDLFLVWGIGPTRQDALYDYGVSLGEYLQMVALDA